MYNNYGQFHKMSGEIKIVQKNKGELRSKEGLKKDNLKTEDDLKNETYLLHKYIENHEFGQ